MLNLIRFGRMEGRSREAQILLVISGLLLLFSATMSIVFVIQQGWLGTGGEYLWEAISAVYAYSAPLIFRYRGPLVTLFIIGIAVLYLLTGWRVLLGLGVPAGWLLLLITVLVPPNGIGGVSSGKYLLQINTLLLAVAGWLLPWWRRETVGLLTVLTPLLTILLTVIIWWPQPNLYGARLMLLGSAACLGWAFLLMQFLSGNLLLLALLFEALTVRILAEGSSKRGIRVAADLLFGTVLLSTFIWPVWAPASAEQMQFIPALSGVFLSVALGVWLEGSRKEIYLWLGAAGLYWCAIALYPSELLSLFGLSLSATLLLASVALRWRYTRLIAFAILLVIVAKIIILDPWSIEPWILVLTSLASAFVTYLCSTRF